MKINQLSSSVLVCALLVSAIVGCGSSKPMTSGLKGKVTYKGEALPDVKVLVKCPENGAAADAKTDASGIYQISTPLPLGKYAVTVEPWNDPVPAPPPPGYKPHENPKIPPKYRNGATSGITWQAKAGSNELNIPME